MGPYLGLYQLLKIFSLYLGVFRRYLSLSKFQTGKKKSKVIIHLGSSSEIHIWNVEQGGESLALLFENCNQFENEMDG